MKTILTFISVLLPFYMVGQSPMSIENLPSLTYARAAHQQIAIAPGKFLVIGGHVNGFNLTRNAEIYNETTKLWETLVVNDYRDMGFIAKLQSGKYLTGGGCSRALGVGQLASSEIYDPENNSFTTAASMAVARTNANAATLADGRVLVVGNWYNSASVAEVYDPAKNSFSSTGACLVARSYPIIIPTNDGGAIVTGGHGIYGGEPSRYVFEKYDANSNAFTELATTIFDGETSWSVASYVPSTTDQFQLPDGKYAVLVYNTASTIARLISINPETNEIKEIITQKPIPLNDEQDASLVFGCARTPLIDKQNNLLHIVQQAGPTSNIILRVVTINLQTGSVNTSKVAGFNYHVSSSNLTMLSDGRILFTGGNKFDNFTLSNSAFILTPATYLETGVPSVAENKIFAYWNAQSDAFEVSEFVSEISLYDFNGKLLAHVNNSNKINAPSLSSGIYLLKVLSLHSYKTEVIKVVRF